MQKEKNNIVDHGFIPDAVAPQDAVLGAAGDLHTRLAGRTVLQPGGHGWKASLPIKELQLKNGLETMNCTVYGTLNIWETLFYRKFEMEVNFSDRYLGIMAGTTRFGNSPFKVAMTARKDSGLIDEVLLPFDDDVTTWEGYYSPKPMAPDLEVKGQLFRKEWKLWAQWVFNNDCTLEEKQARLMDELQYSPVGVSVKAWKERNGLYFKLPGERDNHFCELFDYEEGVKWYVYDHYEDVTKELEWNYDFGLAIGYDVTVNDDKAVNWALDLWESFWRWIVGFYKPIGAKASPLPC